VERQGSEAFSSRNPYKRQTEFPFLVNGCVYVNEFLPALLANCTIPKTDKMKILVVDDEKKIADTLAERLRLRGFDAVTVYDGASALSLVRTERFEGIVLDLRLPDINGIEVLRQTMKEFPAIRVVILSGHGTERDFQISLELGAIACFQKPANIKELTAALAEGREKGDVNASVSGSSKQD
jgi:DNA-binding NtrC family response regulator